ncbi:DMT family transporter, partial [bacterium]|nr:DMT family transporter [bacterium]
HERADLWAFAKLGLFGVFLNQVLFIVGLSYTTATNVGILMPAIPVFTAALAAAFRVERLTAAKIVGIASAVAGALVVLDAARAAPMSGRLLGNVLILANCASYAMYLVLQRPVLARVPPLTLTAGAYAAGGLGVVIVSSSSLSEFTHQTHASLVYLGLAYVILMPTILGYAANMWAVRHSSSTLAATYVTLQPIVTASLAAIFLGETLGWREAIALVLIVTGLMLVAGVMPRWKRHAALEPEPPEAEPDEEPSPIATGGAPFE